MQLTALFSLAAFALAAPKPSNSTLTYSYTVPDVNFDITLQWGFPTNDTIRFRLSTPGEFYAGLGFGNTGTKADMQVGWVKDNIPVVQDFFEEHGSESPKTDQVYGGRQDLFNTEAFIKDWRLTIGFTRKLDTGDPFDKKIDLKVKQDFVWAFCSKDYFCDGQFAGDLDAFHGLDGRGVIFGIDLLSPKYRI